MSADWLRAVAPTLATALGGPLGGLAVSLIGGALGVSEPTQDKIKEALSSGQLTSEQITALKQAELQAQQHEKELGFKFAELDFRDRDSARSRETTVRDSTNRRLAFLLVGGFVASVGATLMGWAKVDSVLAGTLFGYLTACVTQVLAYYFGSTAGSQIKSELLAKSMPAPKQ